MLSERECLKGIREEKHAVKRRELGGKLALLLQNQGEGPARIRMALRRAGFSNRELRMLVP